MSTCPVCGISVPRSRLEFHVNICLDRNGSSTPSSPSPISNGILSIDASSSSSSIGRHFITLLPPLPPLPIPEIRSLLPELRLLRMQNAAVSSTSPPGGLLYFKLNTIEKKLATPLQSTLEPFTPSFIAKISLDGYSFTSPIVPSKRLTTSKSLLAEFSFEGIIEVHEFLGSAQILIEVSERDSLGNSKVLGIAKVRLVDTLSIHAQSTLTEIERKKRWKNIIALGGWPNSSSPSSSPISSTQSSPISSPKKRKNEKNEDKDRERDRASSSSPLSILGNVTKSLLISSHLHRQSLPVSIPAPHGRFTSFDDPGIYMKIVAVKDTPLKISFLDEPQGGWLGTQSLQLIIRIPPPPQKKVERQIREKSESERETRQHTRSFWQRLAQCFSSTENEEDNSENETGRVRRQSIRNVITSVTTALNFSKNIAATEDSESMVWKGPEKALKKKIHLIIPVVTSKPLPPPPPPPPPPDILDISVQFIYVPHADILRIPGSTPHITPAHRAAIDGNSLLLRSLASSKREVLLQRTTPVDISVTKEAGKESLSLSHLSVLDVAILAKQQHIVALLCAAILPSPRLGAEALGLHALHIASLVNDSAILQTIVSAVTQGAAEAARADVVANSVRARLGNASEATREVILHSSSASVRGLGLGAGGMIQPRQSDVEDVENLVAAWSLSSKRLGTHTRNTEETSHKISSETTVRVMNFLTQIKLAQNSIPECSSSSSSSSTSVFDKARLCKSLSMKRLGNGSEIGLLDLASGVDGITPLGFCALRGDPDSALVLLKAGAHPGLTESRFQRTILMMALLGGLTSTSTRVALLLLFRIDVQSPYSSILTPQPSSTYIPLGCCRGVTVNQPVVSLIQQFATSSTTSLECLVLRPSPSSSQSIKISFLSGSDTEGLTDDKAFITGKQLREKISRSNPAATSTLGETALFLATLNACEVQCSCCSTPTISMNSSISQLAIVRLLIDSGCSRGSPILSEIESVKHKYVCGTTALHVAAQHLNLCATRLLTLSDSSSVFSALMALKDREESIHQVWDLPEFQNEEEIISFCTLLAKNDERDWRGVNLPSNINLPTASHISSSSSKMFDTVESEEAFFEALCEALCEAISIIQVAAIIEPFSGLSDQQPFMGDDGRGSSRRISRFSHRTITTIRDTLGRTPLALAATSVSTNPIPSSLFVLRLLFKLRTLEIWAQEKGYKRPRFFKNQNISEEEEEEEEFEIDL